MHKLKENIPANIYYNQFFKNCKTCSHWNYFTFYKHLHKSGIIVLSCYYMLLFISPLFSIIIIILPSPLRGNSKAPEVGGSCNLIPTRPLLYYIVALSCTERYITFWTCWTVTTAATLKFASLSIGQLSLRTWHNLIWPKARKPLALAFVFNPAE